MKPAFQMPPLIRSDLQEARKALGYEPKAPVGLLVGTQLWRVICTHGWRAPCPIAVSADVHPLHEQWFWHAENFAPFTDLIARP